MFEFVKRSSNILSGEETRRYLSRLVVYEALCSWVEKEVEWDIIQLISLAMLAVELPCNTLESKPPPTFEDPVARDLVELYRMSVNSRLPHGGLKVEKFKNSCTKL